jgi:hypothetical protein
VAWLGWVFDTMDATICPLVLHPALHDLLQAQTGGVAPVQTAVAAGRKVISDAGVLVNAVVISCPHPDVYREIV